MFTLTIFGDEYRVFQFDIKGDNDRTYKFTKEEFEKHWDVLAPENIEKKSDDEFNRINQ